MKYTINYFRENIEKTLSGLNIMYKNFPQGDLGTLDEIVLENSKVGVVIDYWGEGFFGVFLYDYTKKEEIINILLTPKEDVEKDKLFEQCLRYSIQYQ
ncbi:MAG: hypothetical protein LBU62_07860 [Bacteroidales bacterium]|jgi:hypothetical protein|nr:hypothetical protein [Bacteroidales bacterium]